MGEKRRQETCDSGATCTTLYSGSTLKKLSISTSCNVCMLLRRVVLLHSALLLPWLFRNESALVVNVCTRTYNFLLCFPHFSMIFFFVRCCCNSFIVFSVNYMGIGLVSVFTNLNFLIKLDWMRTTLKALSFYCKIKIVTEIKAI